MTIIPKSRILEILKMAHAKVQKGWTQGPYAVDERGVPCTSRSKDACKWCARGALSAVVPDGAYYCNSYYEIRETQHELETVLEKISNFDCLLKFNEHPKTTKDDVLKLFDKTIHRVERAVHAERASH